MLWSNIIRAQLERKNVLEKLSRKERTIRKFLYYPDGTTRVRTRRLDADLERDKVRRLAQALLHKHNDVEVRSFPGWSRYVLRTGFLIMP